MDSIISHSPEETFLAGQRLGQTLRGREVIALDGDLGSGKTHFVKGVASGLEYSGTVTSPTFTLVHEYLGGRVPLYHFDFYRLETAEDLERIGFDDYLQTSGVLIIEWASKFAASLPGSTRWLQLSSLSSGERQIAEVPASQR